MKHFRCNKLTTKQLRKEIYSFAKQLGVKRITFNDKAKYISGTYNASKDSIYLDTKQTKKQLLSTFFHELGHKFAILEEKWVLYHYSETGFTPDEQFAIENGVDQIANKLWNKHVEIKRWGRYKYAYPKSNKYTIINWLTTK